MSLPAPIERTPLHRRTIVCDGYRRADGLYDIEASIVDRKAFAYREPYRGERAEGAHLHEMWIRLTLGADMVVRDIEVDVPEAPYPTCQQAKPSFKKLIGATVGRGWREAVQAAVGSTRGCTHMRELLFPMATVAFQTIGGWTPDGEERSAAASERERRPFFIDGCISWAVDGEVVARLYPQFAVKPQHE